MVYKIYKSNNYIIIIDENDNYFEEHCATVLVTKNLTPDTTYTITFFRPESVPQAFYNIPFADIRQQSGAPYASVAAWETWYTSNTGLCSNNVVLNSILATLQAQTDVEGVYVKDIGNSDKIVLQVKVWDQDSQTYIATYYYNADGSLYTPVGPLEWVGPSGAVAATIVGPLGTTTDCADAVAVTFCDALNTEVFDQGDTLDSILTELQSTLDVNVTNTVTVDASDLDIRDLDFTTDSVDVSGSNVNATIVGPIGIRDCSEAVSVALCDDQNLALTAIANNTSATTRTPNILLATSGTALITVPVYSITFFNQSPDVELITFDGALNYVTIQPGLSITMDAGGNNTYPANSFGYDIIGTGPILITYNS